MHIFTGRVGGVVLAEVFFYQRRPLGVKKSYKPFTQSISL